MNKQDIVNYVLETPENINPAILGQFLDELEGGGGGQLPDNVWAQSIIKPSGEQSLQLESHSDKTIIVGGDGITTKTKAEWADLAINHDKYECALVIKSLDVIKTHPLIWNESELVWEFSNDESNASIDYNKTTTYLTIYAEYYPEGEEMTEEQMINTTLQIVVNEK